MSDLHNEFVVEPYREARDFFKNLRAQLAYDRVSVRAKPVPEGSARQIVDYAAEDCVDVIVMSSHGRFGVSRWTSGSVAAKVLSGASCAILVTCGLQSSESGRH